MTYRVTNVGHMQKSESKRTRTWRRAQAERPRPRAEVGRSREASGSAFGAFKSEISDLCSSEFAIQPPAQGAGLTYGDRGKSNGVHLSYHEHPARVMSNFSTKG